LDDEGADDTTSAVAKNTPAPAALPGQREPHQRSDSSTIEDGSDNDADGDDDADAMEVPYWWAFTGQSARTSLWRILVSLPSVVGQVWRVAYRADRSATVTVGACALASASMASFGLLASVRVLAALFAGGPTPRRVLAALPALGLVAGLLLTRGALDAAVSAAEARLLPRVRRQLQAEVFGLAVAVPLDSFDEPAWCDATDRAQEQGIYHAGQAVRQTLELISATLGLVGAGGVLVVLNPLLLPLLVATVVPPGWAAIRSARRSFHSRLSHNMLYRRFWVFSWLLTDRDSAAELRACDAQDALLAEHDRLATRIETEEIRLGHEEARSSLLGRAIGGTATGVTYLVLGAMLVNGWLPLSAGGTAVLAVRTGQSGLSRLVMAIHEVYEHALWLLDLNAHIKDCRRRMPPCDGVPAPQRFERVSFENVSFSYPDAERAALDGVSLTIRRGQTVAFVGANGSGKSTTTRLLAGLYAPSAGRISWDGTDASAFDQHTLHQRVGIVLQDPVHWPVSARANIALGVGRMRADDPVALAAAARDSGAAAVIESLPRGWDTILSKRFRHGTELSAGQWSKIAVARGLYKRAPIIVLDEPTAAMDPRSEHAVYEAVLRLRASEEQAIVLVSHRLASVVRCDHIYVFDDGRVIEHGTHEELMNLPNGEYRAMFTLQASAYQVEN
jgi:ATP-binding cassette subfamily B protein